MPAACRLTLLAFVSSGGHHAMSALGGCRDPGSPDRRRGRAAPRCETFAGHGGAGKQKYGTGRGRWWLAKVRTAPIRETGVNGLEGEDRPNPVEGSHVALSRRLHGRYWYQRPKLPLHSLTSSQIANSRTANPGRTELRRGCGSRRHGCSGSCRCSCRSFCWTRDNR